MLVALRCSILIEIRSNTAQFKPNTVLRFFVGANFFGSQLFEQVLKNETSLIVALHILTDSGTDCPGKLVWGPPPK